MPQPSLTEFCNLSRLPRPTGTWVGIICATWLLPVALVAKFGAAQAVVSETTSNPHRQESSEKEHRSYILLARNTDDEPTALKVAITRFVPKSGLPRGLYVDLVSAVHVADRAYYRELNRRFRTYDAVLYELVAPEGTRVPRGGVERDSAVSWLQGGMTKILGLSFQLDEIDYTRKNFVHADMTPQEFAQSMKDRGESMLGVMTRIFLESFAQQAKQPGNTDDIKLLAALISPNREHALKVVMAEQFANLDSLMGVFESGEGSTLVTERNKKAISVLQRQIKRGKRRLAIFYGAAHMQDMAQQLESALGMRRTETTWVVAWNLALEATPQN